jgi:predicted O-methyltransferase YrrM
VSEAQWKAVDKYVTDLLIGPDPALDEALAASSAAGLPEIAVAPNQGKLLQLLARMCGARRILELGTLGGYSTIWLARALPPDGQLITLEADPTHADVAKSNIAQAGLGSVVEVRLGRASDTLEQLAGESTAPFDLTFIDADKANIPAYFEATLGMSRPGSVIIVDNVVRDGTLIDADSDRPDVRGVRELHSQLSTDPRVSATTLQTVGTKGYDGLLLAVVNP